MKLDLKLLAAHLSRAGEGPAVPSDNINDYLLNKILIPNMNGDMLRLRDIDFEAFDVEDVDALADYYDRLRRQSYVLGQWAQAMGDVPPVAANSRAYC